ncbi:MAG: sigma-70 family RNA polymerase sigma factor [Candidatus Cyclobacteriaceae bacterium M3_2C_046]
MQLSKKTPVKAINDSCSFRQWFEEVYTGHFERMYRYAFSITKSKDLAEDVVEEVFLNIWEKKDGNRRIRDVEKYLYVSVKHAALRVVLKNPHQFLYSDYQEAVQVADQIDPESILLGNELQQIIDQSIASLPPHCGLVYDLIRNKGKSYQDVADELGISKKTLEGHISKALASIRKALNQYFQENQTSTKWISGSALILLIILFSIF